MDKAEYIQELLREAAEIADSDLDLGALSYLIQMALDEAVEIANRQRSAATRESPE